MKMFRLLEVAALVTVFSLFASVGASKAVPLGPPGNASKIVSPNAAVDLVQPVHYRRYLHWH